MEGFYSGEYAVNLPLLVRQSDGRKLLLCESKNPAKYGTPWYFEDVTEDESRFVSSVWHTEFEHRGLRYQIKRTGEGDTATISVLRKVTRRRRRTPLDAAAAS